MNFHSSSGLQQIKLKLILFQACRVQPSGIWVLHNKVLEQYRSSVVFLCRRTWVVLLFTRSWTPRENNCCFLPLEVFIQLKVIEEIVQFAGKTCRKWNHLVVYADTFRTLSGKIWCLHLAALIKIFIPMFLKDSIQWGEVLARDNVSVRQRCLVPSARHRIVPIFQFILICSWLFQANYERSDCIPIQLARNISNVRGARVILMRRSTFSLYASRDLRFNTGVENSLFQIISIYEVLGFKFDQFQIETHEKSWWSEGTELRFSW